MASTISRATWTDDTGAGTDGTIINNARLQADVYDKIDAMFAGSGSYATFTFGGIVSVVGNLSLDSAAIFTTNAALRRTTSDGADTGSLTLNGGGAAGDTSRGGYIEVVGNEHARTGSVTIALGNVANAVFQVWEGGGTDLFQILESTGAVTFTSAVGPGGSGATWNFNDTASNGGALVIQKNGVDAIRIGTEHGVRSGGSASIGCISGGADASWTGLRIMAHYDNTFSAFDLDGTTFCPATDGQNSLGLLTRRWTTVYATTGTINTSDRRRKDDVGESLGLGFVKQLAPRAYRWKKEADPRDRLDHHRLRYGLYAQDVMAIAPEFVHGNEADGFGLNYADFVAPLIRAVQQLADQVEDLQKGKRHAA